MSNEKVWMHVQAGRRIDRPETCPEDFFEQVLAPALRPNPRDRPTFGQLVDMIAARLPPEARDVAADSRPSLDGYRNRLMSRRGDNTEHAAAATTAGSVAYLRPDDEPRASTVGFQYLRPDDLPDADELGAVAADNPTAAVSRGPDFELDRNGVLQRLRPSNPYVPESQLMRGFSANTAFLQPWDEDADDADDGDMALQARSSQAGGYLTVLGAEDPSTTGDEDNFLEVRIPGAVDEHHV